jgi:hypothetical protein
MRCRTRWINFMVWVLLVMLGAWLALYWTLLKISEQFGH